MKLTYIILSLAFVLAAGYGMEKFFAGLHRKQPAVKAADKREIKKIQAQARRGDAGKTLPEPDCDVQALLSNNFFDLSRNAIQGKNESASSESKLENLYQLMGVLEIGDCKAAVIVNRNQPQRSSSHAVKGKAADKRIYLLGDTLGSGYKLSGIEQKSVKFTKDGREQELAMFQSRKGAGQAGPGNAAPATGSGNMPALPPDSNMSRPPRNIRSR
jgi:hypothetical protein